MLLWFTKVVFCSIFKFVLPMKIGIGLAIYTVFAICCNIQNVSTRTQNTRTLASNNSGESNPISSGQNNPYIRRAPTSSYSSGTTYNKLWNTRVPAYTHSIYSKTPNARSPLWSSLTASHYNILQNKRASSKKNKTSKRRTLFTSKKKSNTTVVQNEKHKSKRTTFKNAITGMFQKKPTNSKPRTISEAQARTS